MTAKMVFDIETSACDVDDMLKIVPYQDKSEPPRGNIKKEETWQAKLDEWNAPGAAKKRAVEHAEKLRKKGALNPLTGYIMAIGVRHGEGEGEVEILEGLESRILKDFWALLAKYTTNSVSLIYGYNIEKFDVRYIVNRSRVHGINPRSIIKRDLIDKYGRLPENFVDIGKVWAGGYGGFDMPKFEEICNLFNIPCKSQGFRGDSFAKLYRNDKTKDQAIAYLTEEVDALWKLSESFAIL